LFYLVYVGKQHLNLKPHKTKRKEESLTTEAMHPYHKDKC